MANVVGPEDFTIGREEKRHPKRPELERAVRHSLGLALRLHKHILRTARQFLGLVDSERPAVDEEVVVGGVFGVGYSVPAYRFASRAPNDGVCGTISHFQSRSRPSIRDLPVNYSGSFPRNVMDWFLRIQSLHMETVNRASKRRGQLTTKDLAQLDGTSDASVRTKFAALLRHHSLRRSLSRRGLVQERVDHVTHRYHPLARDREWSSARAVGSGSTTIRHHGPNQPPVRGARFHRRPTDHDHATVDA